MADSKPKAAPATAATTATAQAETETKPKAAPASGQTAAPEPVDLDALRDQIRAEEQEKLRAEMVDRQEAEAARQAEIDAEKDNFDEVVCMVANVHTSKGKMVKGGTKHLPKPEADTLVALRKVKRT